MNERVASFYQRCPVQLYYSMLQHSSTTANRRVKPARWTLPGGAAWHIFWLIFPAIFLFWPKTKMPFSPNNFPQPKIRCIPSSIARQVGRSKSVISRILHFYIVTNWSPTKDKCTRGEDNAENLRVNPISLSYPFPLVLRVHVRVRAIPILVLIEG